MRVYPLSVPVSDNVRLIGLTESAELIMSSYGTAMPVSSFMAATDPRSRIARRMRRAVRVVEGAHWELQPRAKDGKWIYSGVKYNWAESNKGAQPYKAKIKALEKMIALGQIDEFLKAKPNYGPKANSYQKTLMQAWENLHAYAVENALLEPKGAVPIPGSSGVVAGWKKVGGKLGTEEGGTYIGPDGAKYYVKLPENEARARNEVLAARLYKLAGGKVVDASLVAVDGKIGAATKWLEGSEKLPWTHGDKVAAWDDFGVHAWLANWDAVGAGSENPMDNIRLSAEGELVLVDAGGAMEFSGMGGSGKKPFGMNPTEFDTLRDPKVNKTMASVFGGMTVSAIASSVSKLATLKNADINELVDQFHGGSQSEKTNLKTTLMARRAALCVKAGAALESGGMLTDAWRAKLNLDVDGHFIAEHVDGSKVAKPEPKVVVTDVTDVAPEPIPKKPDPDAKAVPAAVPPPPMINSPTNPSVQKKLNAIWEAAKSGNASKVEAIKTNPSASANYPKKIHAYKVAVLAALGMGGTADPAMVVPPVAVVQPSEVAPKPVVEKPEHKVEEPVELVIGGGLSDAVKKAMFAVPTPEFLSKKTGDENKAVITKIKGLIAKDDLAAVQAMADAGHPSPKVAAYLSSVLWIANAGEAGLAEKAKQKAEHAGDYPYQIAHGSDKLEDFSTTATISEKAASYAALLSGVDKQKTKEIGYWHVSNAAGLPDVDVPNGVWVSKDFEASLKATGEKAYKKLPKEQRDAVYAYTGGDYKKLNLGLRTGSPSPKALLAAAGVRASRHDLPAGMKLSRKYTYNALSLVGVKPGAVVADNGIVSTSTSPGTWHGNIWCDIEVGPGVKGLAVDSVSSNKGEREVLFPPGQRFMVLSFGDNVAAPSGASNVEKRLRLLALPSD